MKKSIIVFTAAVTLFTTAAFAGNRSNDNPAEATFAKEFQGALDVKWSEGKDVISASFVLGNSRIVAYFNSAGELLGTARNILFNQLPLTVVREINNRYTSAPVYDITEYTVGQDTFYHMDIETGGKHLRVKISSEGDVAVLQRFKK